MKKFFALVLALAMVMSMAATSFAAIDVAIARPGFGLSKGVVGYDYSADSNSMTAANGFFTEEKLGYDYNGDGDTADTLGALLTYGDTVYFPLIINGSFVSDYCFVEKLKAKVSYEMGEDLVEDVSIVKMRVDQWDYMPMADWEADYLYFIAFKTVKKATTADADVVGTLELSRKAVKEDAVPALYKGDAGKDFRAEIDDVELDFAFNLFYENSWLTGAKKNVMVKDDMVALKWDTDYALKFDGDDEVEFTFGTEENEGSFNVDISGQGKVYLRYNTKADDAIVAANPGVDMHFVNFNGAKFNRVGEFAYEMEDGVACYKVVNGGLVAIPGAEYDAADEAFYFNTRTLDSYVFATAELVNPVVEAPVVEAPVATNPSTGA